MRLFLYEYTCAAGADHAGSASLRAEGAAMLRAMVEDFSRLPNVEIATLLADCFPEDLGNRCRRVTVEQEPAAFRRLAAWADFTLVIAPEFDDLLATRCCWVEQAGGRLLGPSLESVQLTADKLALADHLQRHAIATPPARLLDAYSPLVFPVVLKPRLGAGSQATFVIRTPADWDRAVQQARSEMPGSNFLVQPYCPGLPASVAFLIGPAQVLPLMPVAQHLSTDDRCRYLGGSLPLPEPLAERAASLGLRA